MARIISKPHNSFFNFSCGVNIWEPSTFRNYAAHHLSKGVQLKHSLKYVDCCSIKEAEKDGSRTKEVLIGPEVKCQLKVKESKGEGFDWDWPPWKNLPQGYEVVGLTSLAFVFCHMDQMNISIAVIPMSHQSWWNAYVAGLVQSTLLWGYMQSQLPGGWIVKTLVGRSSLYQFVEDRHPFGAAYQAWDRHPLHKQWATHNTPVTMRVAGAEKGGGVLDKPIIEKTTPGRESEFDMRKSRKMSPPYRVLLHNDNYNKREYVVQVLMKVIPGMTLDNAVNIMQEAHYNDMSVVIVCGQADAEEYCTQLRGNGLLSSIDPADGGGCH